MPLSPLAQILDVRLLCLPFIYFYYLIFAETSLPNIWEHKSIAGGEYIHLLYSRCFIS